MLRIEGLTVRYRAAGGAVTALSDVSLDVPSGRTLAVVGESGSGKSTIALALLGLLPPEAEIASGRIDFGGLDLGTLSRAAWQKIRGARIALVFQDPFAVLNPSLRIGAQIGEGLRWHRGLDRQAALARAVALLEEVGIPDAAAVAQAFPHELSGGMRQRALIAGALAAEPELLVLDEPTTALDVTIEAQILDLLQDLQRRRGLTMLVITHNLGVVRRIADETAVLYAGQIVEQGPTGRLFETPLHPYAKGLLAAVPRLDARPERLASIAGGLPDLRDPPVGCRFAPRCPFAEARCGEPQVLDPIREGSVRCWRAHDLVGAPWPREEAAAPVRTTPARTETLVDAADVGKSYELPGGAFPFAFEGFQLVRRPPRRLLAVDGVSLTIAAGEVVGLVGESGSGKTTLGRTLLRLVEPDHGQIRIAGEMVTGRPQSQLAPMRKLAQIVFQNPDSSLNPRKRVGELIARPLQRFGIVPPGEVDARVRELLDLVRLPARYADRYPHQMSGGEKQRVGIARALATEPRFLVCDEPVSALDVSVQAAVVNLLADLRDRLGVAYLFISHDISVVAHLADRIAVMYRGRIVEIGRADEVMSPPFQPYTEALLSAVPSIGGEAAAAIRLPIEPRRTGASPACVFSGRCPRRIGPICESETPPERAASASHSLRCHHSLDALVAMERPASR